MPNLATVPIAVDTHRPASICNTTAWGGGGVIEGAEDMGNYD